MALNNFAGADSAAVNCSADPAKVLIQCPSLAQCNRPGTAILTLGRVAGEDGINITQPTGSNFNVHGVVFANSNIDMVKGNLVTNAARYGVPPIVVRATQAGPNVELAVEDDGPGVDVDLQDDMWEPYVRATADGESPGLGLSIVRALAEANGGWARYEPDEECASRFVVSLPAKPT